MNLNHLLRSGRKKCYLAGARTVSVKAIMAISMSITRHLLSAWTSCTTQAIFHSCAIQKRMQQASLLSSIV